MNISINCKTHEDVYTNFCCNLKCLKPLCPDCINSHNKLHFNKNEVNEYDTIRRVIQKTKKKLKDYQDGLQKQLERINNSDKLHTENLINELKTDLFQIKEIIQNQINIFFENMEIEILKALNTSVINIDFNELVNRIENEMKENKYLVKELSNGDDFTNLKLGIKKNTDELFKNIKNEIDQKIETKINLPVQIVLNKNKVNNFNRILKEILFLKEKSIFINQNNKEDIYFEETNKKFMKNKEYFENKFK